jgi:CRP/FNR family transcriptional regulator
MKNSVNSCVDCNLKSSVVSVLNKNELTMLEEGCSKMKFNKGELIFKEGSPAQSVAYIRNGFIKLCKKGLGGKDYILSISKSGAYLGIQNLNRETKTNYFSAIAVTDTDVCFIDIGIFLKLLKRNGEFATEVISYIFNDEMNYFDRLLNNVQQQLPGKLANTLLYFCRQVYSSNSFDLHLTKSELGSLIGTSRECVTRILKEFYLAGIIEMEKNSITILDENKLEEIKLKG